MSLRFEQRVFHIWEIFNVFFLLHRCSSLQTFPSVGVFSFPLINLLARPTQWAYNSLKPALDRCELSRDHYLPFYSLCVRVWKHLLVFMWVDSENVFGKVNLFMSVESRPQHLQTYKYRKQKKVIEKLKYNPADFFLNAFGFLMSHMLSVKLESIMILKFVSVESTS